MYSRACAAGASPAQPEASGKSDGWLVHLVLHRNSVKGTHGGFIFLQPRGRCPAIRLSRFPVATATGGQILAEELTLQAARARWLAGVTFEMLLATLGTGQGREPGLLGGPGGHRRAMGRKEFVRVDNSTVHPLSLQSSHHTAPVPTPVPTQFSDSYNSHPQNQWDALKIGLNAGATPNPHRAGMSVGERGNPGIAHLYPLRPRRCQGSIPSLFTSCPVRSMSCSTVLGRKCMQWQTWRAADPSPALARSTPSFSAARSMCG